MDWRALSAWIFLVIPTHILVGQNMATKNNLQNCAPKIVSSKDNFSRKIHFGAGEKYIGIPIVAFDVSASGDVSEARIKRSSGVQDVDRRALMWVRSWKYTRRPATCPVVDTQAGVTIDFAAN